MHFCLGLPTHRVDAAAEFLTGDAIGAIAVAAERAGFDSVFVTDHPAPPAAWVGRGGHHALDPFVALSFAAATTTRLRLQTNLLIPAYRHPLLVAKAAATLDVLSGGRVILGVGAGYLEAEFRALEADFDNRNAALDGALVTIRQAWSGAVGDVACLPRPVQQPGPPVWVGGNSRRALRRVVEHGDGWVPMPSPARAAAALRTPGMESVAELRGRLAMLREYAQEAGRPVPADIAFIPSGLAMTSTAADAVDYGGVVDELAELAEAGVNWAVVTLSDDSRTGLLSKIDRFAEAVIGSTR
jgi:probable F420-dependent oxidoreductase